MKVMVIGGTGLMGVPTVKKLLDAGHDVSILSRGQGRGQGTLGAKPDIPDSASVVTCDRNDAQALQEALKGFEIVVDFVVQKPSDLDGIIAAHTASPLIHYVFISTNMVYPGGPEEWDISKLSDAPPWREEDADVGKRAKVAADDYGGHKLRCELALQEARAAHGLPYTILRPPAVIGPRCDSRFEFAFRLASGLPPLPPFSSRPYNKSAKHQDAFQIVFCDDVATAILAAISTGHKAHGEAFNVAQGEPQTLLGFVSALQEVQSERAASFTLPSAEAIVKELDRWNFPCQGRMSISKASKVLDWKPTPFKDFLRETACWHENNMTVSGATRQRTSVSAKPGSAL